MTGPLALSPSAHVSALHFGGERQPLLWLDEALADPDHVIAIAARHDYRPIGPFYPGIRAPVSQAIAMALVDPIMPKIVRHFELDRTPRYFECFLSIVTAAPMELAPIQRLPHFDGLEQERIAVLLYLDRSERGGTAFYRQRATGFESVDEARYPLYRTALEAGISEHGMPPSAYIDGDTPLFEQTHTLPGHFNSAAIYRGNTLHCAALGGEFAPDHDPRTGRLTLNLFLD